MTRPRKDPRLAPKKNRIISFIPTYSQKGFEKWESTGIFPKRLLKYAIMKEYETIQYTK